MHLVIPSAIQQLLCLMHLCIAEQLQILFFGKKFNKYLSTLYFKDHAWVAQSGLNCSSENPEKATFTVPTLCVVQRETAEQKKICGTCPIEFTVNCGNGLTLSLNSGT